MKLRLGGNGKEGGREEARIRDKGRGRGEEVEKRKGGEERGEEGRERTEERGRRVGRSGRRGWREEMEG